MIGWCVRVVRAMGLIRVSTSVNWCATQFLYHIRSQSYTVFCAGSMVSPFVSLPGVIQQIGAVSVWLRGLAQISRATLQ